MEDKMILKSVLKLVDMLYECRKQNTIGVENINELTRSRGKLFNEGSNTLELLRDRNITISSIMTALGIASIDGDVTKVITDQIHALQHKATAHVSYIAELKELVGGDNIKLAIKEMQGKASPQETTPKGKPTLEAILKDVPTRPKLILEDIMALFTHPLDQLCSWSSYELLNTTGIGKVSVQLIKSALKEHGLALRGEK